MKGSKEFETTQTEGCSNFRNPNPNPIVIHVVLLAT